MEIGDIIDEKYELLRLLGEGGMGRVYEARHLVIDKRVALKCLHSDRADDRLSITRFVQEARAAAKIGSEHIVDVTDGGTTDSGTPYLVMELLEGSDLATVIMREGPLSLPRTVALVRQACEGLSAAHSAGIIHRDLKPENLFVSQRMQGEETLKVFDFGIAKFKDLSLTSKSVTFGTIYYMAPEQIESAKLVDERADIYSLGVILFELLTGKLPFEGTSIREVVSKILTEEPALLGDLRPELPSELGRIVSRAMAREREDRFCSMAELGEELGRFALGREIEDAATVPERSVAPSPASGPPLERSSKTPRKWLLPAIVGVMFVFFLAAVLLGAKLCVGDLLGCNGTDTPVEVFTGPVEEPAPGIVAEVIEVEAPGRWMRVPAGNFVMGSPSDEGRWLFTNETQHDVRLTRGFAIQSTEVTQGQFEEIMGYNPSHFTGCGADCPVEELSWHEAAAYCNRLSTREGLETCYECEGHGDDIRCAQNGLHETPYDCPGYRLPTEAEWEYAARAGFDGPRYGGLRRTSWYWANSRSGTHPVGQKAANGLGLHDMLGNVWEWCHDWYGWVYPPGSVMDPWGPGEGIDRVKRGGSWLFPTLPPRFALRGNGRPHLGFGDLGFRPAKTHCR